MKIYNLLFIILVGVFSTTIACKSKTDDSANQQITTMDSSGIFATQDPAAPGTPTPTTNPNEPHWKCPKNCKGSGGPSQGKCPVCGSEYVHNAAYHNQAPGTSPVSPIKIDPATNTTVPANTAVPASAAAQNEKGVYHYICSKGCAGGAGVAGNCAKCGNPLTHNQAFHDN